MEEQAVLASLTGRRVRLRPVYESDYKALYDAFLSEELGVRWRFRGSTPSPESFSSLLWDGVLTQFVVAPIEDVTEALGLVVCYNANMNGYAYVAATGLPETVGSGLMVEAMIVFIDYVFSTFSFRKVYAQTFDFNYSLFRSGAGSFWHEEGRLKEHEWCKDRYWDFVTLAIYRAEWSQQSPRRFVRDATRPRSASERAG